MFWILPIIFALFPPFILFFLLFFFLLPVHFKHTTPTHWRIKTARGYSSLGDYLPTFHPSAPNLPQSVRQSLKTSFLLGSRLSLSLTLARGQLESLAWKMLCLAVSPVIVNITQTGTASKLPLQMLASPLGWSQIYSQAYRCCFF